MATKEKETLMTRSDLLASDLDSPGIAKRAVRRHPMVAFFALACAFAWVAIPIFGLPLGVGPTLAALVVLSLTEGRSGIAALFRQIAKWRVNWKWYVAAIGLPAGAAVAAAAITVAMGAPAPTAAQLAGWTGILPNFLIFLVIPAVGPWEEPGFRGFAFSGFLKDRSPLIAGLLVGLMIVVWHTPLFFMGEIPMGDVVFIMAGAVVFAWMMVGTKGSVLLAMVMHGSSNAVSGEYLSPMFTGTDATTLGWVRAGIWCVFAVMVIVAAGRSFRSRRQVT